MGLLARMILFPTLHGLLWGLLQDVIPFIRPRRRRGLADDDAKAARGREIDGGDRLAQRFDGRDCAANIGLGERRLRSARWKIAILVATMGVEVARAARIARVSSEALKDWVTHRAPPASLTV